MLILKIVNPWEDVGANPTMSALYIIPYAYSLNMLLL